MANGAITYSNNKGRHKERILHFKKNFSCAHFRFTNKSSNRDSYRKEPIITMLRQT